MTSPRILVTGATGNVGGPLLSYLQDSGKATVRAAARRPEALAARGGPIEAVAFDFDDPRTYGPALEGVDKLFLMRPPAVTDVAKHMDPVVRAARGAGVGHIVFLSLLGVEKNPLVPHARIERSIVESGVPYTFLRAGFFMQNLSTTHREDIRDHGEIFVPAGRGKTSFIDTRDIAAVAARALTEEGHENKAHDLTGAEALDYYDVAAIFTDVLHRLVRYTAPSPLRFAARFHRRGAPLSFIAVMTGIYTVTRFGLSGRVTLTTAQILGRPPISMRQFVEDHRACWER